VSDLKRFSLVLVLVAALTLVFASSAAANFGPHGGYLDDTDACAGCHRAHTSFSDVRYLKRVNTGDPTDDANYGSALLVGESTSMTEFCNACHGDLAPGASTNVEAGLFDGGPSAYSGIQPPAENDGVVTLYETSSTAGAPLNGGGFSEAANLVDWEDNGAAAYEAVTSTHDMDATGVLWGDGNAANRLVNLTCTSCHDPHGSSNYRLLKDNVNGRTVGGYTGGTPVGAFVYSVETGYDDVYATNGWLKGEDGATQMDAYRPDYTSGSTVIRSATLDGSLSAWCSACHWQYDQKSGTKEDPIAGTYNYLSFEGSPTAVGPQVRHRHPVDIPLTAGDANLSIPAQELANVDGLDPYIPLEVSPGVSDVRRNQVGCLTCHFAHGGPAEMTGWSNAVLEEVNGVWVPVTNDTTMGVQPARGGSSLLRANDRGVCQRCHNK